MNAKPDLVADGASRRFERDGFLANIPVLTPDECALLAGHVQNDPPPPLDWHKGRAATDRLIYDVASRPAVVELVKSLLGDDVVLWGAVIVEQSANDAHAWHTDIETSAADARSASVWIGLENTSAHSTLELISGSHRAGRPVQQVAAEHGVRREAVTREQALAWAREHDPQATLVCPAVDNGCGLVFDGRIWHASFNRTPSAKRVALLLQYAAADMPIRMPDFAQLEWPFRFKTAPRPPALVVSGEPNHTANRLVPPPSYDYAAKQDRSLQTCVRALGLPLPEDKEARWKPYPVLRGRSRTLGSMGAHVSVLSPGHSPHPPHVHTEEEILLILDGEAELVVVEGDPEVTHVKHVAAGSFVYYPAYVRHTIRNTSVRPVTYLMFKWRGPSLGNERCLLWSVHEFGRAMGKRCEESFATTTIFEGPTSFLQLLHAHTSVVRPGGGYAAHVDAHDVAIVLHSGTVTTLGRAVEGPAVIYYSAGESHGLRNTGAEPARYLVFEFHSQSHADLAEPIPTGPPLRFGARMRFALAAAVGTPLERAYKAGKRSLARHPRLVRYVKTLRARVRRT